MWIGTYYILLLGYKTFLTNKTVCCFKERPFYHIWNQCHYIIKCNVRKKSPLCFKMIGSRCIPLHKLWMWYLWILAAVVLVSQYKLNMLATYGAHKILNSIVGIVIVEMLHLQTIKMHWYIYIILIIINHLNISFLLKKGVTMLL